MSLSFPSECTGTLGVDTFQYELPDGQAYTIDHASQTVFILESNGNWSNTGSGDYAQFCQQIAAQIKASWIGSLVTTNTQPTIQDANNNNDTVLSGVNPGPISITFP